MYVQEGGSLSVMYERHSKWMRMMNAMDECRCVRLFQKQSLIHSNPCGTDEHCVTIGIEQKQRNTTEAACR